MRYHGNIGFGTSQEIAPGVWDDVIIERPYYGDVVRDTRNFTEADKVNNDLTIGNSFSIVADGYIFESLASIRYIEWAGSRWTITEVVQQTPRLLIRVGSVYNGPTA